jgi:hypothetical protein
MTRAQTLSRLCGKNTSMRSNNNTQFTDLFCTRSVLLMTEMVFPATTCSFRPLFGSLPDKLDAAFDDIETLNNRPAGDRTCSGSKA